MKKQNKQGVSLIVLVITIIVMTILASAVIISLDGINTIDNAKYAVEQSNLQEVQYLASMIWAEEYLDGQGKRTESELKQAIEERLGAQNINMDKYSLTVTKQGVTVERVYSSQEVANNPSLFSLGASGNEIIGVFDKQTGHLVIKTNGVSTANMKNYTYKTAPFNSIKEQIKSVTIEKGVLSIGVYALYDCYNMTSVSLPDGLVSVGKCAFMYCDALTSVVIPNSVTTLGEEVFRFCSALKEVTIPNSITVIPSLAFAYCPIETLTIPGSVTEIQNSAFASNKAITSIYIPDSVTTIGNGAFRYCTALTTLSGLGGVSTVGRYAFADCTALENVTLKNGIKCIGDQMFDESIMTSLVMPDSITTISGQPFLGGSKLTSIHVSGGLKTASSSAFAGATKAEFTFGADFDITASGISVSTFKGCTKLFEQYGTGEIVDGKQSVTINGKTRELTV